MLSRSSRVFSICSFASLKLVRRTSAALKYNYFMFFGRICFLSEWVILLDSQFLVYRFDGTHLILWTFTRIFCILILSIFLSAKDYHSNLALIQLQTALIIWPESLLHWSHLRQPYYFPLIYCRDCRGPHWWCWKCCWWTFWNLRGREP